MSNRQIKFRAFTRDKKMHYNVVPFQWDYCISTMSHKCISSNGVGILGSGGTEAKFEVGGFSIIDGHLTQFTGKSDLHNKEIFEGDILRATDESEFGEINHYYICVWINEWCIFAAVEYQEYENYVKDGASALDESMFWTFNIENGSDFTVCGNIYEHPDYIRKAQIEEEKTMNEVLGDADEIKD